MTVTLVRLPRTMVGAFVAISSPWTDDEFRAFLGQMGKGVGCVETHMVDGEEVETGYLVWYHSFTADDLAIITVLTAAYEWVMAEDTAARSALMAAQAVTDRASFLALKAQVDSGAKTEDEARAIVKVAMLASADFFGALAEVEAIYDPPVVDELVE